MNTYTLINIEKYLGLSSFEKTVRFDFEAPEFQVEIYSKHLKTTQPATKNNQPQQDQTRTSDRLGFG